MKKISILTDDSDSSAGSRHSSEASELEIHGWAKQKRLLNRIVIHGLPKIEKHEDLRGTFLRLCRRLKVDVSNRDIVDISRRKNTSQIKVELRKFHIKEDIRTAPLLKELKSGDILKLPANIKSSDVFINHDTTPYYLEMDIIGRKAIREGSLHSFNLTSQGFLAKRNVRSKAEHFSSIEKLTAYIADDESKWGKKKQRTF